MNARACLYALLATAAATAQAQPVYKCVSDSGKVTYSQNPCYGENWHRLGERHAQRKAVAPAAPAPAATARPAAANSRAPTATAQPATAATTAAAAAAAPAAATAAPAVARP